MHVPDRLLSLTLVAMLLIAFNGEALAQPADEPLPHWEEWEAIKSDYEDAKPLGEEYPDDPQEPVVFKVEYTEVTTATLGAALILGNRSQSGEYLQSGADITAPIWVVFGDGEYPKREFAAHLAIGAAASGAEDASFVTYVLERGADVDAMRIDYFEDKSGQERSGQASVLFWAVISDDASILKAVLDHGLTDLNSGHVVPNGETSPLFMAISRQSSSSASLDMVRLLLEHGADPDIGFTGNPPGARSKSATQWAREFLERRPSETAKQIVQLLDEFDSK